MTTSYSHSPSSHISRRASVAATAPYTIPHKQSQSTSGSYNFEANGQTQHLQKPKEEQLSSSVPLLSREFVVRRISEGESGRLKEELKCEACGKGYKHISSLAKHLWEHTPEWNVTKKLLISKHQQVQLLEAASILVSMNDIPSSPKSTVDVPPTIDEEKVQFNPKYTERQISSPSATRHTSPLNDTISSVKMRTHSISQVPPSNMNDVFGSSPAKIETGSLHGGFLDVPKRSPTEDKTSPKEHDDDDDDGVFGAMD